MKTVKDKQILVGADFAGYPLKEAVVAHLKEKGWKITDLGVVADSDPNDTENMFHRVGLRVGAQISEEVIAYLADNISANVREIEGALSSLVANASFLGRKITTSLAKEILKVYVKLYQKEITIEQVRKIVCEQLDIDGQYVLSPKDLCTVDFLDRVIDAGVRVLKMEGRARGGEYVKRVVEAYDKALRLITKWAERENVVKIIQPVTSKADINKGKISFDAAEPAVHIEINIPEEYRV